MAPSSHILRKVSKRIYPNMVLAFAPYRNRSASRTYAKHNIYPYFESRQQGYH